ncbi:MAG: rhodanese-like domain-containing protein [Gammaproteobacteria bacterium]|nr:rhodanese-like domain-containing protein [Gammaproteobacteria bacterium]
MSIAKYFQHSLMSICLIIPAWTIQAEQIESIKGANTIDAFEALNLFEKGATFIDVRDEFEFQLGHIRSAVHLDLKRDFNDLYLIETLDRDIPIVIYCNSAHCYRSAVATFLAVAWGYENVHYFKDGYFTWLALDLPVVMGHSQDKLAKTDAADSEWRIQMKDALEQVQLAKSQGFEQASAPTVRSLAQ